MKISLTSWFKAVQSEMPNKEKKKSRFLQFIYPHVCLYLCRYISFNKEISATLREQPQLLSSLWFSCNTQNKSLVICFLLAEYSLS